ncbi:MAG: tetratricopeptide repeat protein [Myxococcota bacterium]
MWLALALWAGVAEASSRGERLALEGRCASAIPELTEHLAANPGDATAAWRLGQCALRQGDHAQAVEALRQALDHAPDLAHARLDLARAHYHLGQLDAAEEALAAAATLEDTALWQLYRGMLAWAREDAETAVRALERARALDAAAVDPAAAYYLGRALTQLGAREEALAALDAAAAAAPGSVWAEEAERPRRPPEAAARGWLELGVGAEYDDNVVLTGRDTPLPANISDEEDLRAVWQARAGVETGRRDATALGVIASYRGRAHGDTDLRDFDTHFPGATVWVQRALGEATAVRADYDLRYLWVDAEPFLFSNAGRLSLRHGWSADQSTAVFTSLFHDEYLFSVLDVPDAAGGVCPVLPPPFTVCGPPGLDERDARERDGWGWGAGLSHVLRLRLDPLPAVTLRGGYAFARFEGEGRDYSHDAHQGFAGLAWVLPGTRGVGLDLQAAYVHRPYRHATTFPDPGNLVAGQPYALSQIRRREDVVLVTTQLRFPLADRLTATAYHRYRDHRSNAEVFDYDQHVVGLRFEAALELF